jgi:hypothetical protein
MRLRGITSLTAFAVVLLAFAGWGAAPAAAATTCTWGGTPAAPTGTFKLKPGLTSTPVAEPLDFYATGPLAGGPGCTGKLTFTGVFHAGSSCNSTQSWDGRVRGMPGVARFAGAGTILSTSFFYDEAGNVVGSEQALVQALPGDSALTDCNTPQGFTHGHFSSVVELF